MAIYPANWDPEGRGGGWGSREEKCQGPGIRGYARCAPATNIPTLLYIPAAIPALEIIEQRGAGRSEREREGGRKKKLIVE